MRAAIVIPAFNEEEAIKVTVPVVFSVLENAVSMDLIESFEIVVVDDGSTDGTPNILESMKINYSNRPSKLTGTLRIIEMKGNQGHMKALEAGLLAFHGDCVITLDADMQDPPETIIQMLSLFKDGNFECIQAARSSRNSDSFFKKATADLYYRVIRSLTGIQVIPHAADYRLISRDQAKMIANLSENKKVFRLLIPFFKLKTKVVYIERQQRISGKSKYTLTKMIKLAADSVIGFSVKPLRTILTLALLSTLVFLVAFAYVLLTWASGKTLPGWTSILLVMLFGNMNLLIAIAAVGEYIGRIYFQLLARPSVLFHEK